jgi:hypothetical protein
VSEEVNKKFSWFDPEKEYALENERDEPDFDAFFEYTCEQFDLTNTGEPWLLIDTIAWAMERMHWQVGENTNYTYVRDMTREEQIKYMLVMETLLRVPDINMPPMSGDGDAFIAYGTSLRTAWLEPRGCQWLADYRTWKLANSEESKVSK